jgi:hypothetical protein
MPAIWHRVFYVLFSAYEGLSRQLPPSMARKQAKKNAAIPMGIAAFFLNEQHYDSLLAFFWAIKNRP